MQSISKSWRLIEEVLCEHRHSVFLALRKPASDAELWRLVTGFGAKLPREFVNSAKVHDGLRDSYLGRNRLFNNWALLPVREVLNISKEMTSLQLECGFEGCQFDATSRIKNDMHWRRGWMPILDADGDKVIIDLDPGPEGAVGQIIKWSNSGSFPTKVLADSFRDWLAAFAESLSLRRFTLDKSGSVWLTDFEGVST